MMTMTTCSREAIVFLIIWLLKTVSLIFSSAITTEISYETIFAKVGDTVKLNCSGFSDDNCPQWDHELPTANAHRNGDMEVCLCGEVTPEYEARFLCKNSKAGHLNLIILNVTTGDSGTYTCTDKAQINLNSTKLIVIDDGPKCSSNVNLSEVIGFNECNSALAPDEVHLSCSAKFHDTQHATGPLLQWKLVGQEGEEEKEEEVLDSNCTNHSQTVTCTLIRKAAFDLNGKSFICSTIDARHRCEMGPIKVLYAFNRNSTAITTAEVGETVGCEANSNNQRCTYKWRKYKAHGDGDEDTVTVSFNNSLTVTKPGDYRCEARCQFRNHSCLVFPTAVRVPETTVAITERTYSSISNAVKVTWLTHSIADIFFIYFLF